MSLLTAEFLPAEQSLTGIVLLAPAMSGPFTGSLWKLSGLSLVA
jgi:hypothetical protein